MTGRLKCNLYNARGDGNRVRYEYFLRKVCRGEGNEVKEKRKEKM